MKTKITLTINEKVINTARKYTNKRGMSLSHLVENYLKLISFQKLNESVVSPKVLRLMGVFKLLGNYDYKVELRNAIYKKYKK